MPTEILGALDNIIAVVVVILILALIVQSLQAFLKKLFAIKSKQIGDSLVELLEHVVGTGTNVRPSMRVASPVLRALTLGKKPSDHASAPAKELFKHVVERFEKLGRISGRGKWIAESISKEDLLKVIASVAPDTILASFTTNLQTVCGDVAALKTALAAVNRAGLPGSASAELARLEHALAPLFRDCESLLDSQQKVRTNALLEEVLRISIQALDPALAILTSVQKTVADAKAVDGNAAQLDAVLAELRQVAAAIAKFRASFETAFAPLRARLDTVGTWFDTVMQSFEERYTRGMRTWSLVISTVLVILLNANLFRIWETVAENDVVRTQLVEKIGPELLKKQQEAASDTSKAPAKSEPAKPEEQRAENSSEDNAGVPLEKESLRPTQGVDVDALKKDLDEMRGLVRQYNSLGLTPFTTEGLGTWASGWRPGEIDGQGWWSRRGDDVRTLFGWFLMVVLLSFGAPFWHDALETLFGVKNLVRKRSSTQNVEQPSGAGNPKP